MSTEDDLPELVTCPTCKRIVSPMHPLCVSGRTCQTCGHMLPEQSTLSAVRSMLDLLEEQDLSEGKREVSKREVWWKPEMGGMVIPRAKTVDPTKKAISEALTLVTEAVKDRRKMYAVPNDTTDALSDVAAAIHKVAQDLLK